MEIASTAQLVDFTPINIAGPRIHGFHHAHAEWALEFMFGRAAASVTWSTRLANGRAEVGEQNHFRIFGHDGLHELFADKPCLVLILLECFGGIAAVVRVIPESALVLFVIEDDALDFLLLEHPCEVAHVVDGDRPIIEEIGRSIDLDEHEVVLHVGEVKAVQRG